MPHGCEYLNAGMAFWYVIHLEPSRNCHATELKRELCPSFICILSTLEIRERESERDQNIFPYISPGVFGSELLASVLSKVSLLRSCELLPLIEPSLSSREEEP